MLQRLIILCTATATTAVDLNCDTQGDADESANGYVSWGAFNSSDCSGDDVCIDEELFRCTDSCGDGIGLCGTIGPYGDGCTEDADCPPFFGDYTFPDGELYCANGACAVCKDGQCKLGNGAPCSMLLHEGLEGQMQHYSGVFVGFNLDACASGFCEVLFRGEPSCQLFLNYTDGCTEDSDCMVHINPDFNGVCVDSQCKIGHGSVCSTFDYPTNLDLCAGGYCMSDDLLFGEAACRSIGDNGTCTTNQDCNYTVLNQANISLSCIDSKCVIPRGEPCGLFLEVAGSDFAFPGVNESFHVCEGGARCEADGGADPSTAVCGVPPTMAPTTAAPTTRSPTPFPTASPTVPADNNTNSTTPSTTIEFDESGALRAAPLALAAAGAFL